MHGNCLLVESPSVWDNQTLLNNYEWYLNDYHTNDPHPELWGAIEIIREEIMGRMADPNAEIISL